MIVMIFQGSKYRSSPRTGRQLQASLAWIKYLGLRQVYLMIRNKEDVMKRIIRAGSAAFTSLLASKAAPLLVGNTAPDFTASSTEGEIKLSQILVRGPVVLALYYADFTPG